MSMMRVAMLPPVAGVSLFWLWVPDIAPTSNPREDSQAFIKRVGIKNQSSGKVLRSHSRVSERGLGG
jgi:hypothetical protein